VLFILLSDAERFELYIALKRFRTEMWNHHLFLRFVRWLAKKLFVRGTLA
jgi:hypothetical protein